ncbi:MAG: UrcA family protein [Pseudomonadota bacterium]
MKIRNIGLAAIFSLGASGAVADTFELSYNPEAVDSYKGVVQLHQSIVETAKEHCPTYHQVRSLADVRSCQNDVVNQLLEKVNSARLTAYHNGEWNEQVASR